MGGAGNSRGRSLGRLALRWPKATLAAWVGVIVLLGVQGLSFDDRVAPPSIDVPGTRSAEAQSVAARYFGIEASIPILLEGPRAEVDRQGRRLAAELRERPAHRVLTPWDDGQTIPELRPDPDAALILVVAKARSTFAGDTGLAIRSTADRLVTAPVHASVSGFSTVGADLKSESLQGARDAEIIAIPVLLLVLLLVFRSPLAALIPAVFGAAAVQAGYGAVGLVATQITITDVAGPLTSMMGLALGVDYSLLLVSRFREHLADGQSSFDAAAGAQEGAGRTVLVAAVTLLIAMLVAIAMSPGDFLLSAALSVAIVAAVSTVGAYLAVPALLLLLGTRIDRWRIGGPVRSSGAWARLAERVQRRPVLLGLLGAAPLLALSVPALGLDSGPPDVRGLPPETRARVDAERVGAVLGPGWTAPFEVFVSDASGPVTTPRRLRAIEDWQRRVARLDGVRTVIGPGTIASRDPQLLNADRSIRRTRRSLRTTGRDTRRLAQGLADAREGAGQMTGGLARARDAARQIDQGADRGADGADRFAAALEDARAGAQRLRDGAARARDGASRLRRGAARAQAGAAAITTGLGRARRGAIRLSSGAGVLATGLQSGRDDLGKLVGAARDARRDAESLMLALQTMTIGRTDPRYGAAIQAAGRLSAFMTGNDPRTGTRVDPSYSGLPDALGAADSGLAQAVTGAQRLRDGAGRLAKGLGRLRRGAGSLEDGLGRLTEGAAALDAGLRRLAGATSRLPQGLEALSAGARRLTAGLDRLGSGAGRLATGLRRGTERSSRLQGGLQRAERRTRAAGENAGRAQRLGRLSDRSPRLLQSGYFVLAALDGSAPTARTQASYGVSLDRGGQAARITVIPESGPNDRETGRLRERLERDLPALARKTGADAHLGGVAAQISDYRQSLGSRLPLLIIALSIVTTLMLIVVLRAVVLPIISVVLNLLTVGASFGVIALLFQGTEPLLGGPGWADILSLLGTFTIVFGLSLDYQVFILTRMREGWDHGHDLGHAITFGIDRTGRVVTGAAAIMGGVFIAFTFSDLTIIKQTGVGLAVAVLIDATLVRLVLLPAAMKLAGRATFWLPRWLDRALPQIDVEGSANRS